jgi:energy-coupling factor transporter ATP-binding protein EcfA2
MPVIRLDRERGQVVMHTSGPICVTTQEVAESQAFAEILAAYARGLEAHHSPLLDSLGYDLTDDAQLAALTDQLRVLANNPLDRVAGATSGPTGLAAYREALHAFVEGLYDYWRSFDRFIVSHSEAGGGARDRRPHQAFNQTMEEFAVLVRGLYRDVVENITGEHPRVYRQVSAGCQVGLVAVRRDWPVPAAYRATLGAIPMVRQVVIDPPFIIDPPTNKRTGEFSEVSENPVAGLELDPARWICYPAVVGPTVVFVYIDQRFIGLGSALANLFELAGDEQIAAGPDAIYVYGAPPEAVARFGELPTVFHDDVENGLLVAAVPAEDRFAYFGYLKKMVLTLHNIAMLERGRMPYHGAFTRIALENGASANVLIVGDTGAGKSETLEALGRLAGDEISDLRIVADDMGSLALSNDGRIVGYGTEIGAFVRLDDLSKGYAFQQLDRAIFMSPHKVNARVVVPVTTLEEVLRGYPVDVLLYANNYEWVDEEHPVVERFETAEQALAVFREGRAMSKGTTTATGLTSTYFVNIFGAVQRREQHEAIAGQVFAAAFRKRTFVGQIRTQLGIENLAAQGPQEAAMALLRLISARHDSRLGAGA